MSVSKNLLCILCMAVMAVSCTEKMDIVLDDSYARLVVEGNLTNEARVHEIHLTSTASYFSNQPVPRVTGARVVLAYGTDSLTLAETQPGVYTTPPDFAGLPGTVYKLNIYLKEPLGGSFYYTAESRMNAVATADSIAIRYRETVRSGFWEVLLYAQEPAGPDYYVFRVSRNGTLVSDSLIEWITYDDRLFDGNYINGLSVAFLSKRRGHNLDIGDTITLQMNGVEKWFHEYLNFMRRGLFQQTPLFSAAPANVKGNISGGALGYFSAYSVSYCSGIYQ